MQAEEIGNRLFKKRSKEIRKKSCTSVLPIDPLIPSVRSSSRIVAFGEIAVTHA